MAKLTDEQVREIRELKTTGLQQKLIAELYGVSQANVSMIVRRLSRVVTTEQGSAA